MKKTLEDKKRITLLVIIGVVILGLVFVLVMPKNKKEKSDENKTSGSNLEELLIQAGNKFYEQHYFPQLEDKSLLPSFANNPINISVASVDLLVGIGEQAEKELEKKECDLDQSRILVYTKEPFKEKDYKVKVELSCKK